jgi:AraC-like DNA-binding protein
MARTAMKDRPEEPAIASPGSWAGTNRSTSATIQPNVLRYLLVVAGERGVDLRPALAAVGLDPELLRTTGIRVSYRQGSAVIRSALSLTGDAHLGLAVGAAQHPTAWGLLGFALLASETVQDAVEAGVRHQNQSGAMVVWSTEEDPDGFTLRADLPDPELDPGVGVFLVDEALSSVVSSARRAAGSAFVPQRVEFAAPRPAGHARYAGLFRCPVRFGAPRNRCVFAPEWARFPLPSHDPWALAQALELLERESTSQHARQDLLEVLEASIARDLPDVPSITEQARRLAVSERTLRRRLAQCGTTYEALVDGVRRERVEQLLRHSPSTLREVARRAGFADERALRRAVRRWHGMTPVQLRTAIDAGSAQDLRGQ